MKSTLQMLLVALLIGVVLAAPVAAATSQGLEWGVALNDRFNFQMTVSGAELDETISEGMYFDVEAAPPTIDNIVTTWAQIPTVDVGGYWANGTDMGWSGLIFMFIAFTGARLCVPIGNFTLLSELLLDELTENVTATTSYYYWVAKFSGASGGETFSITTSYLKSDGFLAKYLVTAKNETATLFDVSVIRDGLPNDIVDLLMSNILIVGIGVGVIIVIGAVVCKKR